MIGFPLKKYIYIYTKSYENINLTDNIDKYNMQYCNNTVIVVHKPLFNFDMTVKDKSIQNNYNRNIW